MIRYLVTPLAAIFLFYSCKHAVEPELKPMPPPKITFFSDRDGTQDIFVMDIDGSNQTNLTKGTNNYINPKFSPDGNRIICESYDNDNWEINIMGIDGKNQKRLTHDLKEDNHPQFSPDGTKIVFESGDEIHLMDSDGSNRINLTKDHGNGRRPRFQPTK